MVLMNIYTIVIAAFVVATPVLAFVGLIIGELIVRFAPPWLMGDEPPELYIPSRLDELDGVGRAYREDDAA